MALTNRQRVDEALLTLRDGLKLFLEQVITAKYNADAWTFAAEGSDRFNTRSDELDLTRLFNIFHEYRNDIREILGKSAMNMIHETQEIRNQFSHQKPYSTEDTLRALDTIQRVLEAVQQPKLHEAVAASHEQVLRELFAKQAQNATRKHVRSIKSQADAALSPWRDVVVPHDDVRTGQLKEAEFAADLDQVARGKAGPEYQDPHEFFARTYLTEGLTELLKTALHRLHGTGGDPVVELQTNFGGGKTHSMIALYHLGAGLDLTTIPSLESLVRDMGSIEPLYVQRAVIVGTKLSPNEVDTKPDGTEVRTLWGELAWQLAGADGYALVADSDKSGFAPGSTVIQKLFDLAGPSLILIDEWVAFARHLYSAGDTPPAAGSFDSNLTFAQSLTEAVAVTPHVLLAASLPSSEIEVGGRGGQEALSRLSNTFSRVKATWRAASSNEGFEIVRRRLFKDIDDPRKRDATILMYLKMYQEGKTQYPTKVHDADYKRRMEAAYPFHPETFDLLFDVWGSLERFQRTRGVLRLMANVVHTLWDRNDSSPLIMPANLPLDASSVITEMGSYLPDSWSSVIEHDIDGDHAYSVAIDRANANFDKLSATRRVARTVFMGSAPTFRSENRGIDDRTIRLGVVQPGESAAIFGDALRTLADKATYLYSEHGRYWFSTQASVTQQAQERLAQLPEADVDHEITEMLRKQQSSRGIFDRVHVATNGSSDIADTPETALVILGPLYAHVRGQMGADDGISSDAIHAARNAVDTRGDARRQYRNALLFLAPDNSKLTDLRKAVADHIVWSGIVDAQESLNLDAQQLRQARSRMEEAARSSSARLRETWSWLLAPWSDPVSGADIKWEARQLKSGRDDEPLAVIAGKRALLEEFVIENYAGSMLRGQIDQLPIFQDGWSHIAIRDLATWFSNYLYLPRLKSPAVLQKSISEGLRLLTWERDTFAYADAWDEKEQRYRGLTTGLSNVIDVNMHSSAVLVNPVAAKQQFDADERERAEREQAQLYPTTSTGDSGSQVNESGAVAPGAATPDLAGEQVSRRSVSHLARRYYGTVALNHQTLASQVTEISRELITHLSSIYGASVKICLEIEAEIPDGVPESTRKHVEDRASDLRFDQSEFVED
ncbi:MAG: DUF499 domain-containing protein [Thermomicrobiales bacterium]|nr:DUF499 domain-containing protein [Thermomicrobiales bacterium]